MNESELLRDYLESGSLMQLATVSAAGMPWMAHCWYATMPNLDLVVLSGTQRRHSHDIVETGKVAGGIIAIDLEGLGQTARGITFEGSASKVDDSNFEKAYDAYRNRWPQVSDHLARDQVLSAPATLWVVEPSIWVLFDEQNFPESPRREIARSDVSAR